MKGVKKNVTKRVDNLSGMCYHVFVTKSDRMEVIKVTVAERLIIARGKKKREDVAKAVGVSVSAIAMYENGDRVPRDEIKVRLADYYKKSVQELFFDAKCHN